MGNAWSWLGLNLGRRAGTVTLAGLVATFALGLGMAGLSFQTSNASYLNATDRAQVENQAYESKFGGDPVAAMLTMAPGKTIDDLFTLHNVFELASLEQRLHEDPWVFNVVTPLDAVLLYQAVASSPDGQPTDSLAAQLLTSAYSRDPSPASRRIRFADMTARFAAETKIPADERTITNPAWTAFLLHRPDGTLSDSSLAFLPNEQHATIVVFLKADLSVDQESTAYRSVQRILSPATFDNVSNGAVLITGAPALLQAINGYLKGGMLTLGAIAGAVMVVLLALFFSVRWRLLPFVVVAVGLIWAFGLAGYLGIPLTLASIAGLPVLLGIGMDYAIQLHSRVEEEVVLDREPHPIQATARSLGPALLVVTFDAVCAFLALTVAKVPMIRQFGWLLVVGVVAVCVAGIVLPLAILGIREHKSPTTGRDFSRAPLSRLVVLLARVPGGAAVPLMVASLAIFAGGLAVEGHLALQTDPLQWIDPHAHAVHDIDALRAGTGSDSAVSALVTTSTPFSDATAAYVTDLSAAMLREHGNLLVAPSGIVNLVAEFTEIPGATLVPPTGKQVLEAYELAPPDIQRSSVAGGGRYLSVTFPSRSSTLGQLEPVVEAMQGGTRPPAGLAVAPGGLALVGVGLVENLAASRVLLTYLAILLVGLFLAVRLRSVLRSLLSLVPVLVAVGAVSLGLDALGVSLSPMTAVSGPLVVAVCTEFTSLLLLRFVEERGRGLAPAEAMSVTASRTGRAFMVSGFTAIAGVATLASSPWPLLRGFGIVVGMNVAVALLSALVVLPPILVWADAERRRYVSRGLVAREQASGVAEPRFEGALAPAVGASRFPAALGTPEEGV